MITGFAVLIPVEFDTFNEQVDFYTQALGLPRSDSGVSEQGNPWLSVLTPGGITLTVHTGRDGKFPYPEFRPTGHGVAFAFEVSSVSAITERLRSKRVKLLNNWAYPDGTQAISVEDPAGNVLELWGIN